LLVLKTISPNKLEKKGEEGGRPVSGEDWVKNQRGAYASKKPRRCSAEVGKKDIVERESWVSTIFDSKGNELSTKGREKIRGTASISKRKEVQGGGKNAHRSDVRQRDLLVKNKEETRILNVLRPEGGLQIT